jgi:hypothetical protein
MTTLADASPDRFDQQLAVVEQMLAECTIPGIKRAFDARPCLEGWIGTGHEIPRGQPPASLLGTTSGSDLVRRLLLVQQRGSCW